MTRRPPTLAVLCATGALAACGGGTSKSDFVQKADAICTTAAQQSSRVFTDVGAVNSAQSAGSLASQLLAVEQRAYGDLKALKAPSDASADYTRYLSYRQQRVSLLMQGVAAAQKGDAPAYNAAVARTSAVSHGQDSVGAKLGFQACAERLPASQQAAIKQVAVRNLTVNDPAECTESFTPAYIKVHFGSEAKCVAAQRGPSPVKTLDVTDITGVSNVEATARVVAHGGPPNGKAFNARFLYQNGRWVQDTLDPAS